MAVECFVASWAVELRPQGDVVGKDCWKDALGAREIIYEHKKENRAENRALRDSSKGWIVVGFAIGMGYSELTT